jgi:hypothetical protein
LQFEGYREPTKPAQFISKGFGYRASGFGQAAGWGKTLSRLKKVFRLGTWFPYYSRVMPLFTMIWINQDLY